MKYERGGMGVEGRNEYTKMRSEEKELEQGGKVDREWRKDMKEGE